MVINSEVVGEFPHEVQAASGAGVVGGLLDTRLTGSAVADLQPYPVLDPVEGDAELPAGATPCSEAQPCALGLTASRKAARLSRMRG